MIKIDKKICYNCKYSVFVWRLLHKACLKEVGKGKDAKFWHKYFYDTCQEWEAK